MELVQCSELSEDSREKCAIFTDGTYWYGRSYEHDPELLSEIAVLRRRRKLPEETSREIVTLERIAKARNRVTVDSGRSDEVMGRFEHALRVAVDARASDLVLDSDGTACRVYALVNDRRHAIGDPWRAQEGERAMRAVFYAKEPGSGQTSIQARSYQGFAVRHGGTMFRLPAKVGGLRGERGPSEPVGEHMFLRIFYSDSLKDASLEALGFTREECEVLERMYRTLRGAIVIGGVTGDGKSTTLATCLMLQQAVFGHALNLVTVEDPVEYKLPGAIQLAVSTSASGDHRHEAFAEALRHFCRINPSSGMVSEIRDEETARQVMRFVDTGHQVWTTIHAGDANGIVFRLLDLGVPVEQACNAGNIALLMKQTIVSTLCPQCRRPARGELPVWLARDLGTDEVFVRDREGCRACRKGSGIGATAWAGYARRRAIAEMIQPDAQYLAHVRDGAPNEAARYWIHELGGIPVHRRVRELVLAGEVDPLDALSKGMVLRGSGAFEEGRGRGLAVVGSD